MMRLVWSMEIFIMHLEIQFRSLYSYTTLKHLTLARIKTFVKLKVNTYSQIPHDRACQHIL